MAFVNYGIPQVQYLSNLAAVGSSGGGGGGITTVPNTDANGPVSSGLTATVVGGTTLYLANTTFVQNDVLVSGGTSNVTLSAARQNQYINVTSSRGLGGSAGTVNYTLPASNGSVTPVAPVVGQWMSLHISGPATPLSPVDVYNIIYQTAAAGTTTTQAATVGSTYTFMCFTAGVWTKM